MNKENMYGGTNKYLGLATEIVKDYEHFLVAMSTHLNSIDPDDIDNYFHLDAVAFHFARELSGCIYRLVKDMVYALRGLSSDEVNYYDLFDAYDFANSIFLDYLKKNGYDVEDYYET